MTNGNQDALDRAALLQLLTYFADCYFVYIITRVYVRMCVLKCGAEAAADGAHGKKKDSS